MNHYRLIAMLLAPSESGYTDAEANALSKEWQIYLTNNKPFNLRNLDCVSQVQTN